MKLNLSLWLVLLVTGLLFISGYLLRQSMSFNRQNRQLILENDSLRSVNIELTQRLQLLNSGSLKEEMGTAVSK